MSTTILVVDDEKMIRWSLKERLTKAGFHVATAASCKEASDAFLKETFDVVLCDIKLPDGDGISLMKSVHSSHRSAVFIMITAYASVENAVAAMRAGAFDYVSKPFNMDELLVKIDKAVSSISIKDELEYLKKERKSGVGLGTIIAESPSMKEVLKLVDKISKTEASTILIMGESGVGKDLIAKVIHYESNRASSPFVNITCTAIPDSLLESELFGHEKGSFTDAKVQKKGLLEIANGGTAFLDEIGDMSLMLQPKLLRFLEEKKFRRVGGTYDIRVEVRVIAATNRNLGELVESGKFREDLFYRLSVIVISIPPLRERREDIQHLALHFIEHYNKSLKRSVKKITPDAMNLLKNYSWPGNVRELRNVIERAMLLSQEEVLDAGDIVFSPLHGKVLSHGAPAQVAKLPPDGVSLEEVEKELIKQALAATGGNKSKAARLLSITRDQLRYKVHKHNLVSPGA